MLFLQSVYANNTCLSVAILVQDTMDESPFATDEEGPIHFPFPWTKGGPSDAPRWWPGLRVGKSKFYQELYDQLVRAETLDEWQKYLVNNKKIMQILDEPKFEFPPREKKKILEEKMRENHNNLIFCSHIKAIEDGEV